MTVYEEPMPWEEEERMKRKFDDAYEDYLKQLQEMQFRYVHKPDHEVDRMATKLTLWQKLQLWWRFFW